MLRKLIGYDMREQKKLNILLLIISPICAAISAVLLYVIIRSVMVNVNAVNENTEAAASLSLMASLPAFFLMALAAVISASAVTLVLAIHYYKKMVTDEAYLTFTLPATPGQHLASKLITGSIWSLIASVAITLDVAIISVPVFLMQDEEIYKIILEGISRSFGDLLNVLFPSGWTLGLTVVLAILATLVNTLSQLALLYLALTLGGIVVNKNKALLGAGLYFGANMVIGSSLQMIVEFTSSLSSLTGSMEFSSILTQIISILVYGGASVVYILFTRHLLTHKLNLA